MRFTKMHGAGNDYVYVDCFNQPAPADPAELARQVADRHFGIGGDGLVLIGPSDSADVRMRMFNADGSESEMCGNAIRCVAKYVYDHGLVRKPTLHIETGAGVLALDVQLARDRVESVRVDMGPPILEANRIPTTLAARQVIDMPVPTELLAGPAGWVEQCGLDPRWTCVSMGNPHVVLYCQDVAAVPLTVVGPALEHAPPFPRRINVHFVQIHSPGEVTLRTWERGSGITLACGTGASAVCVAGALTGRTKRQLLAHLPGGELRLEWHDNNHVFMTGPAVEVFSGEWPDTIPATP